MLKAGRYTQARQMRRMPWQDKTLGTYLVRVVREIKRMVSNCSRILGNELQRANRLLE